MKSDIREIVCISNHYWDDPWFRKHHFMSRFVKNGYKVAFIEPSYSIMRRPDSYRSEYQTNNLFSLSIDRREENLYLIKPPRGLPKWSNPLMNKLNHRYFSFLLGRGLQSLGFEKYILWIYHSEYAFATNVFKYEKLIYEVTDDLAAYKKEEPHKYEYINKCIHRLVQESNLTIVTASTIYDSLKNESQNIHLIPNGYDESLFSDENLRAPDDMKSIKGPIIGFVGTLFSFLDYNLIEYIVQNNTDKSFVFVGNCEENAKKEWDRIIQYDNVFWLGKKNKDDIPSYLNNFDLCINPFKVDQVSRSVSPLKVFEYLAMKKPVVSARMESLEQEEVAAFIYFASTYQEFHEKINAALKEKHSFKKNLDYQIVLKYSWNNLFEKVRDLVLKVN